MGVNQKGSKFNPFKTIYTHAEYMNKKKKMCVKFPICTTPAWELWYKTFYLEKRLEPCKVYIGGDDDDNADGKKCKQELVVPK